MYVCSYQNLDEKNKSIEKENEELRQTGIDVKISRYKRSVL